MAKDPVCGMEVVPVEAKAKVTHKGETYYFCAPACKDQFEKEPDRYATKPRGCCSH